MSTYNCIGVVVKHSKFNDSDRLIKLLTSQDGLLDVIVKGARKITSKKGGSIDLLNQISAQIAKGESLDILTEVEIIDDYASIKKDLFKISLAYYLTELLVSSEYDGFECSKIFKELIITLDRLKKSRSKLTAVLILKTFELQYLELTGYKMQNKNLNDVQDLFDIISSNNLENLLKIKYNTETVRKLSDSIQSYTETVLERKFKKVNLLA